jgi:hypothetical protein
MDEKHLFFDLQDKDNSDGVFIKQKKLPQVAQIPKNKFQIPKKIPNKSQRKKSKKNQPSNPSTLIVRDLKVEY